MSTHPMKPETIARRAAERQVKRAERRAATLCRMTDLASRDGPDSFWAEYLAAETERLSHG